VGDGSAAVLTAVGRFALAPGATQTAIVQEDELYQMPDARLKAAAARFENWLQRENIDIPASTSWARYFAALPAEEFKGRELAQQFVREYEQARWSRRDENSIEHVLQLVEALETDSATQRK
jgi:acyl-homoserine lactone acylase PvdQ